MNEAPKLGLYSSIVPLFHFRGSCEVARGRQNLYIRYNRDVRVWTPANEQKRNGGSGSQPAGAPLGARPPHTSRCVVKMTGRHIRND
ncbi:hypothetical protein O3P69_002599 [Scylla paramamosain]|uniref:Uncharacterized protein n=1 Tax=Scylla paramamosain TaxID=85552 RepID=A0AAW0UNV5_SCYPA